MAKINLKGVHRPSPQKEGITTPATIRRYMQPVRVLLLMCSAYDLPVQEALREAGKQELGLTPEDEEWYYD